jgi:hypothetical protein
MSVFAVSSMIGIWLHRYLEIYPIIYQNTVTSAPIGIWEVGILLGYVGVWGFCYLSFMDAFPRMRVFLLTSKYRDEVQVPCDPKTMEPLPALALAVNWTASGATPLVRLAAGAQPGLWPGTVFRKNHGVAVGSVLKKARS